MHGLDPQALSLFLAILRVPLARPSRPWLRKSYEEVAAIHSSTSMSIKQPGPPVPPVPSQLLAFPVLEMQTRFFLWGRDWKYQQRIIPD
ncbi:hypothetical protein EDD21DRAFT_391493 [Dissophora ornata]|nr:hypothetical protein EDD21DRAFT_391493 [Dissophora ornata]